MAVDAFLSRLSKVKTLGAGKWLACCPAHNDKTPSMTVSEVDDGRILIHCFAGCEPLNIVESVGFTMADLFPERLGEHKPIRHPFSALDVLRALRHEAAVMALACAHAAEGKPIHEIHKQRVDLAAERIADAAEYIHALG